MCILDEERVFENMHYNLKRCIFYPESVYSVSATRSEVQDKVVRGRMDAAAASTEEKKEKN